MAWEVTRLGLVLSPDWEPTEERTANFVAERTNVWTLQSGTTPVVTNRVRNIRVGNAPA